jgi:solute carrier family 25 (mitochondrial carnitine/acylcarnitine transporter), member 20/29
MKEKGKRPGGGIQSGALASSGDSKREAFFGLLCGATFGVTSVLVGHPFDTVKTRMQVLDIRSMVGAAKSILRDSGPRGLYSGMFPMLVGSAVFRSAQFSAYGYGFAKSQEVFPEAGDAIPGTFGLRSSVLVGSLCAGTIRALIECPLEVVKIRRQISLSSSTKFVVRDAYHGFGAMWLRSVGLLSTALVGFDYAVRFFPDVMGTPVTGDFLKGSIIATIAWMTIWPSEAIKNHVQANKGSKMSVLRQASMLYQTQGLAGFYRGLLPGMMRSIFANGFSMVAFMQCQRWRIDPTEEEE